MLLINGALDSGDYLIALAYLLHPALKNGSSKNKHRVFNSSDRSCKGPTYFINAAWPPLSSGHTNGSIYMGTLLRSSSFTRWRTNRCFSPRKVLIGATVRSSASPLMASRCKMFLLRWFHPNPAKGSEYCMRIAFQWDLHWNGSLRFKLYIYILNLFARIRKLLGAYSSWQSREFAQQTNFACTRSIAFSNG